LEEAITDIKNIQTEKDEKEEAANKARTRRFMILKSNYMGVDMDDLPLHVKLA